MCENSWDSETAARYTMGMYFVTIRFYYWKCCTKLHMLIGFVKFDTI